MKKRINKKHLSRRVLIAGAASVFVASAFLTAGLFGASYKNQTGVTFGLGEGNTIHFNQQQVNNYFNMMENANGSYSAASSYGSGGSGSPTGSIPPTGSVPPTGSGGTTGGGVGSPTGSSLLQQQANWIETAFFEYALTGSYNSNPLKITSNSQGSILNPTSSNSWNAIPEPTGYSSNTFNSNYSQLYKDLTDVDFFLNTSGTSTFTPAYQYINTLAQTSTNVANNTFMFMNPSYNTIFDMEQNSTTTQFNNAMEAIGNTPAYQLQLNQFLYTYAMLWQESTSSMFDYNLTSLLYNQQPGLIWTFTISGLANNTTYLSNWSYQPLVISPNSDNTYTGGGATGNTNNTGSVNGLTFGSTPTPYNWNAYVNGDSSGIEPTTNLQYNNISGSKDTQFLGIDGFQGMQTSANTTVSGVNTNFWSYSQVFNFQTTSQNTQSFIFPNVSGLMSGLSDWSYSSGKWSTTNANKWLGPTVYGNNGNVLMGTTGSNNIYAYMLLYPFAFPTGYNNASQLANFWNYTIDAQVWEYSSGTPPTGTPQYVLTPINSDVTISGYSKIDQINMLEYYFPFIGPNQVANWAPNGYTNYQPFLFMELYLMFAMYQNTSSTLLTQAETYWNNKGFYIKLTGTYESTYGSLIDSALQYNG